MGLAMELGGAGSDGRGENIASLSCALTYDGDSARGREGADSAGALSESGPEHCERDARVPKEKREDNCNWLAIVWRGDLMAEVGWWLTTWTEGIEKIEVPALQLPFRTSSLALPLANGGAYPAQPANHSPTREKQGSETGHGPQCVSPLEDPGRGRSFEPRGEHLPCLRNTVKRASRVC